MVNAELPATNLELLSNRHEEGGDVNGGISVRAVAKCPVFGQTARASVA
jgi:hypothetical protein